MKEETNNNKIKSEKSFNSNSSLLGKKIGHKQEENIETEEKQSTREEK